MNNDDTDLSEETLNAFLDGQLDTAERSQVLTALQGSPGLRARVCELHALQDQVRNAYFEPPRPEQRRETGLPRAKLPGRLGWPHALAASVLLMLGATAGWVSGVSYSTPRIVHEPLGELSFQAARVDGKRINDRNVIVQIDSSNSKRLELALDTAEKILSDTSGGTRKVMILANDGGINLLRTDMSPYRQRIAQMLTKYPNVTLVACRNGVEKLRQQSIAVNLLPGAQIGQSAVDEIISHLSKGWLYIKV